MEGRLRKNEILNSAFSFMIVIFIILQIDRSTAIACVSKPLPNLQRKNALGLMGSFSWGMIPKVSNVSKGHMIVPKHVSKVGCRLVAALLIMAY